MTEPRAIRSTTIALEVESRSVVEKEDLVGFVWVVRPNADDSTDSHNGGGVVKEDDL